MAGWKQLATTQYVDNAVAGENQISEMNDVTITDSAANEILFTTGTNAWANKTLTEAGLLIGTDIQAWDAQLDTWSSVSPSANGKLLVAASDYAAMRGLLDLEPGTDVQAYDAGLAYLAGLTITNESTMQEQVGLEIGEDVQAQDAGLAYLAGLTITNETSFKVQTNLEIGVDVQAYDAQLATVAGWSAAQVTTLGTIATVTDDVGQMIYTTAADTFAATDITAAGRGFLAGNGVAGLQDYIDMAPSDSPSFTDLTLTGGDVTLSAATTIALTNHTVASGQKVLTIKGSESKTTETDLAGSDVVIEGGNSTGTASGGDILFKIYKPHPSTSSANANSVSTALTIDATDASVTFAANATVTGDLTVSGTTTTINTETINLADNIINLNSNAVNGNTKPANGVDAGLTIERGNWVDTQIFWDEEEMCWKMVADKAADSTVGNSVAVEQTILGAEISSVADAVVGTLTHVGAMMINSNDSKMFVYM